MSAVASATSSPADAALWHGYLLASSGLPPPTCAVTSDDLARPAYTKIKSAEYMDSPEVLDVKAELLIQMWTAAKRPLVYAGAGISTSSGIQDYASNAKGSVVQAPKMKLTKSNIEALKPTPAHRVITALEKAGRVWGWLQQNHDGLAQKAGFPARKVNELHGAWLDSQKNPIIKMSGSLRGDLFAWMLEMEEGCDFVFAAGTSFSGLNADRCANTCAERHQRTGRGQGIAVVSIQQTPMDCKAALRVFSKIDEFMLIVARKMKLQLGTAVHPYSAPALPVGPVPDAEWEAERSERIANFAAERDAAPRVRLPSVVDTKERKPAARAASVPRQPAPAAAKAPA